MDVFRHRFVDYVTHFKMINHPADNGFFVETMRSREQVKSTCQQRKSNREYSAYTVIYYLLSAGNAEYKSKPFVPFHSNKSDIVHYYHDGWPVKYITIDPQTKKMEEKILGPDIFAGHQFHLKVDGGKFKGAVIDSSDKKWAKFDGEIPFALISEQVSPGFEYSDHKKFTRKDFDQIQKDFDRIHFDGSMLQTQKELTNGVTFEDLVFDD